MRIGVISYSFERYMNNTGASYTDICDLAKEMGYEGIEFTPLSTGVQPAESVEALARLIRRHCENIGLSIISYTIGGDFIENDPAAEVARLKGCIDIAALLGAPLLRHDVARGYEGGWREAIRLVAPYVREVTEYAATKGIRTSVENHGFFLQDAARVEELILAVNHENYGWLVDIGNFACADENSIPAVAIAAPYAFHVHAKDFLIKPADAQDPGEGWFRSRHGSYLFGTCLDHGAIPLRACINILKENGYDGWITYEFEGIQDNLLALKYGLDFLRKSI